jgi:diaminopimelate decarboxylase
VGEGVLTLEGLGLRTIADAVGTPAYVYSAAHVREQYRVLDAALADVPHRIHYAVKANGNLAILGLLRTLGAGVDIVSSGELTRALVAGFMGADVVFSGVGKTREEMRAALAAGVGAINVESQEELAVLGEVAVGLGTVAPIGLRVNPEVAVPTHPYTATGTRGTKFGVAYEEVEALARRAAATPGVVLRSLAMHVGSQVATATPFAAGIACLEGLVARVRAAGVTTLTTLDLGGGFGIQYREGDPPFDVRAYAAAVVPAVRRVGLRLAIEPGRFLVGNAGVLLTRVLYHKRSGGRAFAVVDAGMNDLIRPSLYRAFHDITVDAADGRPREICDVVGPVCETGDFLAQDRELPVLGQGDLLAVRGAGAYGFSMASHYNSRPRPPEVLVDGDRFAVVRDRETSADLLRGEHAAPAWRVPAAEGGA